MVFEEGYVKDLKSLKESCTEYTSIASLNEDPVARELVGLAGIGFFSTTSVLYFL